MPSIGFTETYVLFVAAFLWSRWLVLKRPSWTAAGRVTWAMAIAFAVILMIAGWHLVTAGVHGAAPVESLRIVALGIVVICVVILATITGLHFTSDPDEGDP